MFRISLVVAIVSASPLCAQEALRFQWQAGQSLTYSVQQVITVTETTLEEGTNKPVVAATVTKLNLTRRWDVKSVEPSGVAVLEMVILGMKQTINRPGPKDKDGKPTVDSIVMDSTTAEGQQLMAAYLNKPIVTIKIDAQGKLLEAKSANTASAERLQIELPFRLTLPDTMPAINGTWDRAFTIKLDPPNGTGEKYDATQTYTLKGENMGYAVIGVATALKLPPKDPAEMPPLVPYLWDGEVYVQRTTNRYAGARLSVKKEITNHQGTGSKFTYETTYTEALAGGK